MTTLDINHLTVRYAAVDGVHTALADVNLRLSGDDFVVAIGASGCGKTSLLNCVAGFLPASGGQVLLDGAPIQGPGAERGVVFQKHALLPWLNVLENVALPLRLRGVDAMGRHAVAQAKLALVGLAGAEQKAIWQLSGGMQQRVGIARALASDPAILLMDEPLGALDAFTREGVQETLLQVWASAHKLVLFITHSVEEALFLGTRLVVMSSNPGSITKVYNDLPFSRQFLSGVSARAVKSQPEFIALREEVLDLIHRREKLHV
ncbi:ATP-binding cassette domain-containing protein [Rhodoferax sp.]|uniref:taurine ABC transporter ATP-binding protein n=1 Tax=Rhodoferax sp. TaxID=50421 RepID=UPI00261CA39C|nr:ATP-binding cassette domain-containing protein [Rhodoferax sp.]MDD2926494.1 ATP-binding cassette domain-containing protein [Rhodoferax sp.]